MREDLAAAGRFLGLAQRLTLREPLHRVESLLDPAETVRLLVPGWWRGHRSVVVVTTSRLLLVRRHLRWSAADQAVFPLRGISHLSVHASPPEGARFRLAAGLDLEEFSVTEHVAEVRRALRGAGA